mgnify:CR=1 FL=1
MYFFYDDNISFKKFGIEHAEIKRLRLFNEKHVPSKRHFFDEHFYYNSTRE